MSDPRLQDRRNNPLPSLGPLGDQNPTVPRGQHDATSPGSSASGANSGSSQSVYSSLSTQYQHGSWPTPGGQTPSAYTYSPGPANPGAQPAPFQHDYRTSTYDSNPALYTLPRPGVPTTTTPESLVAPAYGQSQHYSYQALAGGPPGSGSSTSLPALNLSTQGHGAHGTSGLYSPTHIPTSNSAPTQPPASVSAPSAHVDSYQQPPPTQQTSTFSEPHEHHNFPYQPPANAESPSTSSAAPRPNLPTFAGHAGIMPPPQWRSSYHPYVQINPIGPIGPGPYLSNLNNPGGHISVVPGIGPIQAYGQYPHVYGPVTQPQSDRPFKCDQCVQSFNRNHDLKRHKRIHLAVKPFPCGSCDKAFSRKDALKRHRMVKGCGEPKTTPGDGRDSCGDGSDPSGRSEPSASESPSWAKTDN